MKRKSLLTGLCAVLLMIATAVFFMQREPVTAAPAQAEQAMSLITATPDEGFALAITLSRKGVTETQPDREVLHELRTEYANDAQDLIAVSQVIAIHFQTIAAANDYWRD